MKKFNVLLVTYTLEIGGAETAVTSIARYLNPDKFRPVVCSIRRGGDLVERLREKNIPIYILSKKRGADFSTVFKIVDICKREKIHIIHTHNFSANLWGRLAAILAKVPCVITTEHTTAISKTCTQKVINRILSHTTDQIIAVSENVRRSHIEAERIATQKIVTIYNGIQIQKQNSASNITDKRRELGLNKSSPVVGIVGRLHPAKGHIYFLMAAKKILQEMPSTKFLIVGDGPLVGELLDYVKKNHLDNSILFLGFRYDRLEIMNCFDVAVLSSIREGLSLTLLEYMAMKKPVVATSVGGNPEVVLNGVNGFLVPPRDVTALVDSIVMLLKDRKFSKTMGSRGYNLVTSKFTNQIMIKKTEELYRSLVCRKNIV